MAGKKNIFIKNLFTICCITMVMWNAESVARNCDNGKYTLSSENILHPLCVPCPENFYADENTASNKCTPCEKGKWTEGNTGATSCKLCANSIPGVTWKDGPSWPRQATIANLQTQSDKACRIASCPDDYTLENNVCIDTSSPCPFSGLDVECSPGTFKSVMTSGACKTYNCVPCAEGSYTNQSDRWACTPCMNGTKTDGTGQTSCNATCSNNINGIEIIWGRPTWESDNHVENKCLIKECPETHELKSGECIPKSDYCEPGEFLPAGATECVTCPEAIMNCCKGGDTFYYDPTKDQGLDNCDEKDQIHMALYSYEKNDSITQTLCPKDQYVYSCNGYTIGYNWLNMSTLQYNDLSYTTNDYNIGTTLIEKSEQLRALFSFDSMFIKYKDFETDESRENASSTDEKVTLDREIILGLLCNPLLSSSRIVCMQCPGNGVTTTATTVDKQRSNHPKLVNNSRQ